MAYFINRKAICFSVLLSFCNLTSADSAHNIFLMTLSILSYAKLNSTNPQLCIVDNPNYASQFSRFIKSNNSSFSAISINAAELKSPNCDAVFFSNLSAQAEQTLIDKSFNPLVLSFSSNNIECEIGSSFCLFTSKSGNTFFKVNLDSLTQSKIHVDPRVLLLAKGSD